MTSVSISSNRVLTPEGIRPATVTFADGRIVEVQTGHIGGAREVGDALLAPGLIDLHGDAFERQVMPRPGVRFGLPVAIADTDHQLIANGITTAFHGVTCSWEGGLRGLATGQAFCAALEQLRPGLAADHRVHWRFEAYTLEALEPTLEMIRGGVIDLLALNNHMPAIRRKIASPGKLAEYAERAETDGATFRGRVEAAYARDAEVLPALRRLAALTHEMGMPLASHDDTTPEDSALSRALHATICEFPLNDAALDDARAAGAAVVLGAPNVLRGGSHCGGLSARDLIAQGRCEILVSDYYYPALFHAPFRLAAAEQISLENAWSLVSRNPARAGGLADRGSLAAGLRADLVLIDDRNVLQPCLLDVWVAGQRVYHRPASRTAARKPRDAVRTAESAL